MHRLFFPERFFLPSFLSFISETLFSGLTTGPVPSRWEERRVRAGKERVRAASFEMVGNIASSLRGSPRRGMAHNCRAASRDAHLRPCRATFPPDTLLSTGKSRSPRENRPLSPSIRSKRSPPPIRRDPAPEPSTPPFSKFSRVETGRRGREEGRREKWRRDGQNICGP